MKEGDDEGQKRVSGGVDIYKNSEACSDVTVYPVMKSPFT